MGAEKQFEFKVKKFLKSEGAWFVKYWGGGQFTKSGIPDLIVCHKGYFLGIELKSPKGHASDLQLHNLKMIDQAGGYAILLYPEDYGIFHDLICSISDHDYGITANAYRKLKQKWNTESNPSVQ